MDYGAPTTKNLPRCWQGFKPDRPEQLGQAAIIELMRSRKGSENNPSRPENRLLLAKVCSLFYQGYTHRQISAKLGLSMNITHRYLRRRTLLDPEKLDPKAQEARARRLRQFEDDIAKSMPKALAGDINSAWTAISAIKARRSPQAREVACRIYYLN